MDRTELLRIIIGMVAFFVAGAQIVMRVMISNGFNMDRARGKMKERSLSTTMVLLLTGIGLGNLTHLHQPPSVSTALISIGVCYAAYSLWDIWRWAQEEESNGVEAHQYRRHHKSEEDA